ncbi:MAG: globin [Ilumatobacter sp.]
MFSRVADERGDGTAFFERLVDHFYDGVAGDSVLLPLYPEQDDLSGARHRLTMFLVQYWGGPHTYMEERGHPRLRMRHFPFHVGPLERDRWLVHMAAAVEATCVDGVPDGVADELMAYFVPAAEHLRNDTGLPISPSDPQKMSTTIRRNPSDDQAPGAVTPGEPST